jgi:hypothetical protein
MATVTDAGSNNTASGTGFTITLPLGAPSNGDVLVACFNISQFGAARDLTLPAGFTVLDNVPNADCRVVTIWGVVGSGGLAAAASYTFAFTGTAQSHSGVLHRITGAAGTIANHTAANTQSPSLTASNTGDLPLAYGIQNNGSGNGNNTNSISTSGWTTDRNEVPSFHATVGGHGPATTSGVNVAPTVSWGGTIQNPMSAIVVVTTAPGGAFAKTLLVQADLSGTAFGGAPTWTDITRFVRLVDGIGITSGRQDVLSSIAPSTLSLVLDNSHVTGDPTAPNGGRFTPGLSTSPWSGRILPGVRFRVTETVNGTDYPLFDGYANDWTAAYDTDGAFTTCAVNCVDILGWMGTLQPLRSIYDETVLAGSPTLFFPLRDPAGSSTAAAATSNTAPLLVTQYGTGGTLTFTGADDGVTLANSGLSGLVLEGPANEKLNAGAGVSEIWFKSTDGATQTMLSVDGFAFLGLNSGFVTCPVTGIQSANTYTDGQWHQVKLTINEGVGSHSTLTIDGTDTVIGGGYAVALGSRTRVLRIGGDGGNFFHGSLRWASRQSTATATLTAGTTGFAGESTDAHITRLLSFRANLGSVLDVGRGTVGVHNIAGQTLQQALLDTAKAEGGVVYADGQGRIVFLNRAHLFNPAVTVTLDAAADILPDYQARIDVQQLANDATVSWPGGGPGRITDATSETQNGVRAISDTYIVNSIRDATDAAGWLVANQKDAKVRAPTLTADILTQPVGATAQAVMARRPLDRTVLSNLPSTAPPTDVLIQGRQITISKDAFAVSFYTSALPRATLRADGSPSANTKLDNGLVIPW